MKTALIAAALASTFATASQAAPPPVPQNLLACSKLQDASERVRCYDAQIAAMNSAAAPQAPTAPAAPTPAAPVGGSSPGAPSASAPAAVHAPPATAASPSAAALPPAGEPAAAGPAAPPRASGAASSAAAAGGAAGAAASLTPAGSETGAAAKFGQEQLPEAARPQPKTEDLSLHSTITGLSSVGSNKFLITLANGQIWRQQESDQVATFYRVGDGVSIERGALGSYHLWTASTGRKNWILVRRAQ
jgi:hypothetical protein